MVDSKLWAKKEWCKFCKSVDCYKFVKSITLQSGRFYRVLKWHIKKLLEYRINKFDTFLLLSKSKKILFIAIQRITFNVK